MRFLIVDESGPFRTALEGMLRWRWPDAEVEQWDPRAKGNPAPSMEAGRYSAILLYMGTDILAIYIFLQFMRGVPRALDEAALLDGASHWTIYWRIVLPLLKPAIVTVVVIKGVAIYNEFYIPFLYMPARDLGVVSTSLFRFNGPYNADYQVIAAAVIIAMVPTLIIFLIFQRQFVAALLQGSVKG